MLIKIKLYLENQLHLCGNIFNSAHNIFNYKNAHFEKINSPNLIGTT